MKRVAVVHWRMAEAGPLITVLQRAGYEVHHGTETKQLRAVQLSKLQVFAAVLDLTRMPSSSRSWAAELRATFMKHLPLVFVDGEPDKVAIVKMALPDATFTTRDQLVGVLKQIKPLTNPVQPPRMMASTRATALKMGVKPSTRVAVFNAPAGYANVIGALPDGCTFDEEPDDPAPVSLWFVRDVDAYRNGLRIMRTLAARSKLWVLYPKLKKGRNPGITQADVRESAIALGLVDYKICAVDDTWTGIAFALKTEKRPSTSATPTPPNSKSPRAPETRATR